MTLESDIVFWHWWIFAVLLLITELFAAGAFFLWMGVSAFVVGTLVWLAPGLGWQNQVLLFSLLSVVSVIIWRAYRRKNPVETDHPLLNRRSAQYIGRTFTLSQPIVNGRGKIRVDDSLWKIEGEDCPVDTRVQVVAVDGVILKVVPINPAETDAPKSGAA